MQHHEAEESAQSWMQSFWPSWLLANRTAMRQSKPIVANPKQFCQRHHNTMQLLKPPKAPRTSHLLPLWFSEHDAPCTHTHVCCTAHTLLNHTNPHAMSGCCTAAHMKPLISVTALCGKHT
jgi:hypothetical protein